MPDPCRLARQVNQFKKNILIGAYPTQEHSEDENDNKNENDSPLLPFSHSHLLPFTHSQHRSAPNPHQQIPIMLSALYSSYGIHEHP
jgi:hypothetical protein